MARNDFRLKILNQLLQAILLIAIFAPFYLEAAPKNSRLSRQSIASGYQTLKSGVLRCRNIMASLIPERPSKEDVESRKEKEAKAKEEKAKELELRRDALKSIQVNREHEREIKLLETIASEYEKASQFFERKMTELEREWVSETSGPAAAKILSGVASRDASVVHSLRKIPHLQNLVFRYYIFEEKFLWFQAEREALRTRIAETKSALVNNRATILKAELLHQKPTNAAQEETRKNLMQQIAEQEEEMGTHTQEIWKSRQALIRTINTLKEVEAILEMVSSTPMLKIFRKGSTEAVPDPLGLSAGALRQEYRKITPSMIAEAKKNLDAVNRLRAQISINKKNLRQAMELKEEELKAAQMSPEMLKRVELSYQISDLFLKKYAYGLKRQLAIMNEGTSNWSVAKVISNFSFENADDAFKETQASLQKALLTLAEMTDRADQ